MENQDKIYIDFKNASERAEAKGFDRMEAVWNRVEEKLDEKKKRRTAIYWKYAGVAAVLLLCLTVGTFLFRNEGQPVAPTVLPENNVTVIDTQKVKEAFDPAKERQEEVVVNEKPMKGNTKYNPQQKDSILSNSMSKKAALTLDPVYFTGNARFSKPKDPESEYKFYTNKITSVPEKEVVAKSIAINVAKVPTQSLSPDLSEGRTAGTTITQDSGQPGVTETVAERTMRDGDRQSYVATDQSKAYSGDQNIILRGAPIANHNPNTRIITSGSVDGEFRVTDNLASQNEKLKVIIRGNNSITQTNEPLYVLDGNLVDGQVLKIIDADWLKSVDVLKDASATSLYGNRGSRGVIIMKTKKLSEDEKQVLNDLLKKYAHHDSSKISVDTEEYESFEENKFENPATAPLSTFSIDVDNASYTNIRRFLNNGQTVPKDAVRVEEMINFFKYQYPQPKGDAPFSINTEYSDAPWNPKHKLLKIGLKGKEIPSAELPASNFVFLIDVSGSMNSDNKLPLLKQSMKLLVNQMREQDRIAIVVYAGAAGLVLPSTSGAEKDRIIAALDNLSAGGSTAGGQGIELAYKTAQENLIKKGNNRVILATDGDFNVGASSNTDMQTLIEEKRKSGVFLTCLGYGMGNYKDSKLEILSDKGNGNYAYIDNMQEATRFLDKEFKGSMYAIAKDVKIQIEFNPKHVQSYRLIGYENRKLRDEDFANDAIDAGELGSGHTVTALYEIIPAGVESEFFPVVPQLKYSTPQTVAGNYNDELATIKFRHKKPDEEKSREIIQVIPNVAAPLKEASGDFKFAAAVAWFGLKLRDSKLIPNKDTEAIKRLATQGLQNDPEGYRAEFVRLVDMVK